MDALYGFDEGTYPVVIYDGILTTTRNGKCLTLGAMLQPVTWDTAAQWPKVAPLADAIAWMHSPGDWE